MFGEVGTQIFILKKINSFRKHGTHENEQLIRSRGKKKKKRQFSTLFKSKDIRIFSV